MERATEPLDTGRSADGDRAPSFKPELPLQFSPLFDWPPNPRSIFSWLFGFPGYLWPWPILFGCLAFATWLLLPDLNQIEDVSPDWIYTLFAANFVMLVTFISLWHLLLYRLKFQGREYKYNPKWPDKPSGTRLFGSQLRENVFLTLFGAVPIWTAYVIIALLAHRISITHTIYLDDNTAYFILLLIVTPIWMDVHFYLTHRLLHWPPLFRLAHHIHHRNVNISPWSGLSMHPVEHLLFYSGTLLYIAIPSHPFHVLYYTISLSFAPALTHHGFGKVILSKGVRFNTDHYMHYMHHTYVNVNFGGSIVPLDRWFGSFHDGRSKRVRSSEDQIERS